MADEPGLMNNDFLFDALMDNLADSIYFKDRQCRLIRVSRKMAIDLGYKGPKELVGKTDRDLFGKEFSDKTIIDDLQVMETGRPIVGLIEKRRKPDGCLNWTSTSKLPIFNREGKIIGLLGITREINELKQAEIDLQYLATHDLLTTLPNRYLFFDRLEQAILRANRQSNKFALLYLDLDGFKAINDRGGHDLGDRVLKLLAERLLHVVRSSDTVARMGGDEFVILLDEIRQVKYAMRTAQKILRALEAPYVINQQVYMATASIGISMYPDHAPDAGSLLKAADHAMYVAKQQKNAIMVFTVPTLDPKTE